MMRKSGRLLGRCCGDGDTPYRLPHRADICAVKKTDWSWKTGEDLAPVTADEGEEKIRDATLHCETECQTGSKCLQKAAGHCPSASPV